MSGNETILEVRNLKKYFFSGKKRRGREPRAVKALDGVSFSMEYGETLGVVGESGCGKSTLGRTILRLHEPTEGQVVYRGKNLAEYGREEMRQMRRELQIIFQDPYSSLNPRMTVSELIAEPLVVNRVMKNKAQLRERVAELMETVGLAPRLESAYPHELDGGRRQRIGIARALSVNPKFIVCDEPVSALDVSIQAQILNLLMDLQDNMGLTYMFITHDLSVVRHISDEIAVMYLGQCVERCESKELFDNPIHPYTKALLDAIQVPDISLRGKRKPVIHGEVTSPIDPKPGCRFATRCPLATDGCWGSPVPLREVSAGHFVACNLI